MLLNKYSIIADAQTLIRNSKKNNKNNKKTSHK
jgi:hypothetical protein